jgi:hypothetical protein
LRIPSWLPHGALNGSNGWTHNLEAARMKRLAIFLIVVPLMIGIFILTRGSIPAGQTSLVWALIATGFLIAAFLLFRCQKPK